MLGMFNDAIAFNQNIGDWDVSSLKYMRYMFQDATSFNQNLENWDVSNVKQVENANGDNVSAMLGIFDRTPLDKLSSWYEYNIEHNIGYNKKNLNFKNINSFSKKNYLNNKNYKSKFGSFKKYQKLKYH